MSSFNQNHVNKFASNRFIIYGVVKIVVIFHTKKCVYLQYFVVWIRLYRRLDGFINQCRINAGPPSATLAQHWSNIDWVSLLGCPVNHWAIISTCACHTIGHTVSQSVCPAPWWVKLLPIGFIVRRSRLLLELFYDLNSSHRERISHVYCYRFIFCFCFCSLMLFLNGYGEVFMLPPHTAWALTTLQRYCATTPGCCYYATFMLHSKPFLGIGTK